MVDPEIPLFNWGVLPEDEHERARHVQTQLLALVLIVRFFGSAVQLVAYVRGNGLSRDWAAMAGDSAILTIYNFRSTLNSILDGVGRCPTLKRGVSTKQLHEIRNAFDAAFPDWLALRDGVCHFSDKLFAPPSTWEMRMDTGYFTHGYMSDVSMHYIVDGRTVSLAVTQHELDLLNGFKLAVFDVFRKVSSPPPQD